MRPTIQQVQEQINRSTRKIGKLDTKQLNNQTRTFDQSADSSEGRVKWRRISFINDKGLLFVPTTDIRTYIKEYIKSVSENTTSDTVDSFIQAQEISRQDSIIQESNLEKGLNVVYFTSVYSLIDFRLPVKLENTVSTKIETVYNSNGVTINSVISSANGSFNTVEIPIPANTWTTIIFYFYGHGSAYSNFYVNTNILELMTDNGTFTIFPPENFLASESQNQSNISLSWDFEPFLFPSDSVEIQRGGVTDQTHNIINWEPLAFIGGYSIRYSDSDVKAGENYFYRSRFVSKNGDPTDWSDVVNGHVSAPLVTAKLTFQPNKLTNLVGYYNSEVSVTLDVNQALAEPPIFAYIDAGGNTYIDSTPIPSNNQFTWTSTVFMSTSPLRGWVEGDVSLEVRIPSPESVGLPGTDLLQSNTAVGTVLTTGQYLADFGTPNLSNIHISVEDDRIDSNDTYTPKTQVFIIPDYTGSLDLPISESMDRYYDHSPQNKTSGIYQIQFSNNANFDSPSDWILWEDGKAYTWNLAITPRDILLLDPNANTANPKVYARVRDKAGNISNIAYDDIIYVFGPPKANLISISGAGGSLRIDLNWGKTPEAQVASYIIYKTLYPTNPTNELYRYYEVLGRETLNFSDPNVLTTTSYNYSIKTKDQWGVTSTGWTNIVTNLTPSTVVGTGGTTGPDNSSLPSPVFTTGSFNHWDYIYLAWTAISSFNFSYYNLYRSFVNGFPDFFPWSTATVLVTGLQDPNYRDIRISSMYYSPSASGKHFGYWVTAVNEAGTEFGITGAAHDATITGFLRTDGPQPAIWISGECYNGYGYNHLVLSGLNLLANNNAEYTESYKIYRAQVNRYGDDAVVETGTLTSTGWAKDVYTHIGSVRVENTQDKLAFDDRSVSPSFRYVYKNIGINVFGFQGSPNYLTGLGPALPNYSELFINYIDNGSFERTNLNGYPDSWVPFYLLNSSWAYFGTGCIIIDSAIPLQQRYIFVKPSTSLYYSHYHLKRSANPSSYIYIKEYNINNVNAHNTISTGWNLSSIGLWTRTGFNFTLTASTYKIDVLVSGIGTESFYLDGIQIEDYISGVSPRSFVDSRTMTADRFQAAYIIGDMISGGTIMGQHIQANTISGREITADSITADKLTIGKGTNLIFNPSFSWGITGASTDYYFPGWLNSGLGSIQGTTGYGIGEESLLFLPDNGVDFFFTDLDYLIPIDNTSRYTLSIYSHRGAGVGTSVSSGTVRIREYNPSGSFIRVMPTITGTNNESFESFTVPKNGIINRNTAIISSFQFHNETRYLGIELQNSGIRNIVYAGIQLEQGNSYSAFSNGQTAIGPGWIRALSIISNNITANAIITTHLSADSVAAGKIAANAISGRNIVASSISAESIIIGFGGNILQDGGLERWTGPILDQWVTGGDTTPYLQAYKVTGADVLFGDYGAYVSGVAGSYLVSSSWYRIPQIDATGGVAPANFSLYLRRNSATTPTGVIIGKFICASSNANGQPVQLDFSAVAWPVVISSQTWVQENNNPSSWGRVNGNISPSMWPIQSGAVYFKPLIYPMQDNASNNKLGVYIDGIQVTAGSGLQAWKPNEGTVLAGDWIKTGKVTSNNYIAGSQGWQIGLDGSAEFCSGYFRSGVRIDGNAIIAGTLTITSFGITQGGNLIYNPTFSWGSGNSPIWPGWTTANATGINGLYLSDQAIALRRSNGIVYNTENLMPKIDKTKDYIYSIWGYCDGAVNATGVGKFDIYESASDRATFSLMSGLSGTNGENITGALFRQASGLTRVDIIISSSRFLPTTEYLQLNILNTGTISMVYEGCQLMQGNIPIGFNNNGVTSIGPGYLKTNSIYAGNILTEQITAGKVAADAISGRNIVASSLTVDKLAVGFGGNLAVDGAFERWSNITDGNGNNPTLDSYSIINGTLAKVSGSNNIYGVFGARVSGTNTFELQHKDWISIPQHPTGGAIAINISYFIRRTGGTGGSASARIYTASGDINGNPVLLVSNTASAPYAFQNKAWAQPSGVNGSGGTWARLDGNITESQITNAMTSGAIFFKPILLPMDDNASNNKDGVLIDALQVTVGSGVQSWKPNEGTLIQGDWIKTGRITSQNFVSGLTGWAINTDGSAEFSSGTFRNNVQVYGDVIVSGTQYYQSLIHGNRNLLLDGLFELYSGFDSLETSPNFSYWLNPSAGTLYAQKLGGTSQPPYGVNAAYLSNNDTNIDTTSGIYFRQIIPINISGEYSSITTSVYSAQALGFNTPLIIKVEILSGVDIATNIVLKSGSTNQTVTKSYINNLWDRFSYSFALTGLNNQMAKFARISFIATGEAGNFQSLYLHGAQTEYSNAPHGSIALKYASPFIEGIPKIVNAYSIRGGKIVPTSNLMAIELDHGSITLFSKSGSGFSGTQGAAYTFMNGDDAYRTTTSGDYSFRTAYVRQVFAVFAGQTSGYFNTLVQSGTYSENSYTYDSKYFYILGLEMEPLPTAAVGHVKLPVSPYSGTLSSLFNGISGKSNVVNGYAMLYTTTGNGTFRNVWCSGFADWTATHLTGYSTVQLNAYVSQYLIV